MWVGTTMQIAIVGCVHGKFSCAYNVVQKLNSPPRFIIMCGDVQACRCEADLASMSVPEKYRQLGDFHKYYTGEKTAPFLTIVVGGNHEASSYMSQIRQGGWLAPNIYYIGDYGVVQIDGVRVCGLSGIYNEEHVDLPRFEPDLYKNDVNFANNSKARFSAYHVRRTAVNELLKLAPHSVDIMVTHDWPRGIEHYGDLDWLLSHKPYFKRDIDAQRLGNPLTRKLLDTLQPQWWVCAHMHVRYTAQYKDVRFIALDKVPRKRCIEMIRVSPLEKQDISLPIVDLSSF